MHILTKLCRRKTLINLIKFKNSNNCNLKKNISTGSYLNFTVNLNTLIVNSSTIDYLQKSLVYIHDLTGLPWFIEIVCISLFTKLITLPIFIYEKKQAYKYQNLLIPKLIEKEKELIEIVRKKVLDKEIQFKNSEITYKRLKNKLHNELILKYNVHPLKRVITLVSTFPIYISVTCAISNLCSKNNLFIKKEEMITFLNEVQPQFTNEGVFWFKNMILNDQTYILPITFGFLYLSIIEYGGLLKRYNLIQSSIFANIFTNLLRILAICLTLSCCYLPSAIVFYWWITAFLGLIQTYALTNPKCKKALGIPTSIYDLKQPKLKEIWKYRFFRK